MPNKALSLTIVFLMLSVGSFALLSTGSQEASAADFDDPGYALIAAPRFGNVFHCNEALKLRSYLLDKGWSDDQIILLGNWNKDYVDGKATKDNIKEGLEDINDVATDSDIVFVAILDHATEGEDGHIYFRTGDTTDETYVKDTEFQGWIDDLESYSHLVVYVASPYSGNFVEGLEGSKRIILSDCGIDETYRIGWACFYHGLTKSTADSNNDGKISIEEAYEWMEDRKRHLDPLMSDFDEDEECFLF